MVRATNPENVGGEPYKYKGDSTSLLSKYNLPITHLDFSHVEKCTNGKELEKILHVLKSGQEGYYPELMKVVEEKLKILLPKSRFLRNLSKVIEQEDLRKEEWNEITKDLNEWVSSISKDNKELESRKGGENYNNQEKPDIRQMKSVSEEKIIKNERRIKSTDYALWDKYDPDTEILKLDLEEEKIKKEAAETWPKKKPKKQVKFNCFATEAEANFEANREKEIGNEYFKACEYDSALTHYTVSLEYKKTVQCLNNRAMTYIKKEQYQKALEDCNSAIAIDRDNFKANFRKAQVLDHMKRFEEGLECIEKCISIDPNNTAVQQLARRLRKQCGVKLEKKRLAIEDVHGETERRKGILKENKQDEKLENESDSFPEIKDTKVLIPIPGTSNMTEPYYVTCNLEDERNTLHQINNRSQVIGFISTLPQEEEECSVNHLEHICSENMKETESDFRNSIRSSMSEKIVKTKRSNGNHLKGEGSGRMKLKKSSKTIQNPYEEDDRDAGGEPYKKNTIMVLPEGLHSPYTFLKAWTSVGNDPTLRKYAHIIKTINMNQLVQVIGCKLDNTMFTTILRTLCMHFTAPGEVEKVYSVLVNIARLPRFQIISMLMSAQDITYVNMLTSFLHQHDKILPDDVKESLSS